MAGVSWVAARGVWTAQLSYAGLKHNLGSFDTEEAAARAYDEKVAELWENPILNFLPDGSLNPDRHQVHRHRQVAWEGRREDCGGLIDRQPIAPACCS
jgi:hypothetical protein